jgi:NADH:ubiquinone oxidoreductase subunit 3 (subunit A)
MRGKKPWQNSRSGISPIIAVIIMICISVIVGSIIYSFVKKNINNNINEKLSENIGIPLEDDPIPKKEKNESLEISCGIEKKKEESNIFNKTCYNTIIIIVIFIVSVSAIFLGIYGRNQKMRY